MAHSFQEPNDEYGYTGNTTLIGKIKLINSSRGINMFWYLLTKRIEPIFP